MWTDTRDRSLNGLRRHAENMITSLIEKRTQLKSALSGIATAASIEDEFLRSIRTLAGAPDEILRENPSGLTRISVFFPSNNVLYSTILYILIPSLYSDEIVVRPSSRVKDETIEVIELLSPTALGKVSLWSDATQREFIEFSRGSELTVFTGTSENAQNVRAQLANSRTHMLTFGSSSTPFVIGCDADLDRAARTTTAARLFNGGQDCLCPDLIFVHDSVYVEYLEALKLSIGEFWPGPFGLSNDVLGSMVYDDAVKETNDLMKRYSSNILYGGEVDLESRFVAPTIFSLSLNDCADPVELFGPVFCLVKYEDSSQVTDWLLMQAQRDLGSYVSAFGEAALPAGKLDSFIVLEGVAPLDAEAGNWPFGGYGLESSSVFADGTLEGRPLLISAEARRIGSTRLSKTRVKSGSFTATGRPRNV